jgi:hypothetical protein
VQLEEYRSEPDALRLPNPALQNVQLIAVLHERRV